MLFDLRGFPIMYVSPQVDTSINDEEGNDRHFVGLGVAVDMSGANLWEEGDEFFRG